MKYFRFLMDEMIYASKPYKVLFKKKKKEMMSVRRLTVKVAADTRRKDKQNAKLAKYLNFNIIRKRICFQYQRDSYTCQHQNA